MPKQEPTPEHEEVVNGITYRLFLENEDQIDILDYCTSGDPAYVEQEKELAAEIARRYDHGDQWAWFCARAEASAGGFRASAFCGCCSYENKAEFLADGQPWADMKPEALAALRADLAEAIKRGEQAKEALNNLPPDE